MPSSFWNLETVSFSWPILWRIVSMISALFSDRISTWMQLFSAAMIHWKYEYTNKYNCELLLINVMLLIMVCINYQLWCILLIFHYTLILWYTLMNFLSNRTNMSLSCTNKPVVSSSSHSLLSLWVNTSCIYSYIYYITKI